MKKELLIYSILAALIFTSCAKEPISNTNDVASETESANATKNKYDFSYTTLNIEGEPIKGHENEPNYIGKYDLPIIKVPSDSVFEKDLNNALKNEITAPVKQFENDYGEYRQSMKDLENSTDEADKDVLQHLVEMLKNLEYIGKINKLSSSDDFLSFSNNTYSFLGGAHGSSALQTFNIDFKEKKILTLADLFNTADYKTVLLNKINEQIKNSQELKDKLYPDKQTVSDINDNAFYLKDNSLVIYYQPYDIGPYVSGFISFEISLDELKDILKDRYANMNLQTEPITENLFYNE